MYNGIHILDLILCCFL